MAFVAFGPSVYGVDLETGREVWSYPAQPERNQTFYAEPAVAEDMVVVGNYNETLMALDPERGTLLWSFEGSASRFIGSAAIGETLVYAGSVDGVLHALDRETGREVWSFRADKDIWAQPLLVDGRVYVTSLDKHLYALDAETGDLQWQFPEDDAALDPPVGAIVSAPSYYEGMLVFGSFNNVVYAVDADTGEIIWEYQAPTNWVWSSPSIDEQSGRVVGADLDGNVFALDVETGEEVWSVEVSGPVVGAPTIAESEDGVKAVYIGTTSNPRLYRLDLEEGRQLVPPAQVEEEFTARFLFFPTGTSVRALPIYTTPTIYDGVVLVGSHDANASPLYALDRESLVRVWAFEPIGS